MKIFHESTKLKLYTTLMHTQTVKIIFHHFIVIYIINNIMKLKLGILNSMSMKHWYKNNKPTGLSASADSYARTELHNLCDKYNTNLSLIPKLNINIL